MPLRELGYQVAFVLHAQVDRQAGLSRQRTSQVMSTFRGCTFQM